MITDTHTGTNVDEVADGVYRINTPIDVPGGPAFNFNQYLLVDDEPLLFHTGPRALFPAVRDAIAAVMPIERLRWIGFSHVEADECGSLNLLLGAAPCRCAAGSRRWARSTTSPTGRRVRWPTANSSCSAATRCSGSTRRTCRTAGIAAC